MLMKVNMDSYNEIIDRYPLGHTISQYWQPDYGRATIIGYAQMYNQKWGVKIKWLNTQVCVTLHPGFILDVGVSIQD